MAYASAPSSKPHTSVTDPWSVTDYARVKLSPPTEHWPVIGRNSRACSLPMNSRSNASERSFECPDAIRNGTKASTQEGA